MSQRRVPVLAVVLGLAALVVVVGVVLALRDSSRPVTVDEARDRLGEPEAPTDPDGPEDRTAIQPPPGVYSYTGEGTESLSLPPLSQSQGPEMPGTVELLDDGCWSFRIDFSNNHWQQWTYCDDEGDLVEAGGQSWQRWMIGTTAITNLSDFTCDPRAMVLPVGAGTDAVFSARCVGTNEQSEGETVSEGPYRYLGEEQIDVGGEQVLTRRFLRERTMSGAQTGTERSEVWFAADTGLPVRNERAIEVAAETPVGSSTYSESGSFALVSLEPN